MTEHPFAAVELRIGRALLRLALSLDRERAVLDGEIDGVTLQPGQLRLQDDGLVGGLVDVHRRQPGAVARDVLAATVVDAAPDAIHAVLHRGKLAHHVPLGAHGGYSLISICRGFASSRCGMRTVSTPSL